MYTYLNIYLVVLIFKNNDNAHNKYFLTYRHSQHDRQTN